MLQVAFDKKPGDKKNDQTGQDIFKQVQQVGK